MAGVVVDFSARDNGTQSYIDNMFKKANQGFTSLASAALSNTKSGKEQIAFIENQIRLTERRYKLERDSTLANIELKKKEALEINKIERKKAEDLLKQAKENLRSGSITRDQFVSKLKDYGQTKRDFSDSKVEKEATTGIKNAEDRLKEDELQSKYQRQLIDAVNQSSINEINKGQENARAFVEAVENDPDASDKDRLIAALTSESLERKEKENKESKDDTLTKAAAGMAAFRAMSSFVGGVHSLTGTQSGFDQIENTSKLAGQGIGALIGGIIGGVTTGGVGAITGAGLGAQAGGAITGLFGSMTQRGSVASEEYGKAMNRQGALTGKMSSGVLDYGRMGISPTEMVELQIQVAKKLGTSRGAQGESENIAYLEKGFGVEKAISLGMLEMQKSNIGGQKDLISTVGGILDKGASSVFAGGDRTMLPEVLQKFSSLQKEFLKTQNSVKDGTVADVMFRFNKLGGQFGLKDYRSEGLIGGIQNSLTNPGGDMMKSMSFQALRRLNPNMDISQIVEERQKGLSSPSYLKSILGSLDQMGGTESSKIMNIAGAFGLDGNIAAARSIYKNREGLMDGSVNAETIISSTTNKGELEKEAIARTTRTEENIANINRAVVTGMKDGAAAIQTAIENAFNNVTISVTEDGRLRYIKALENKVPTGKKSIYGLNGYTPNNPYGL